MRKRTFEDVGVTYAWVGTAVVMVLTLLEAFAAPALQGMMLVALSILLSLLRFVKDIHPAIKIIMRVLFALAVATFLWALFNFVYVLVVFRR